MSIFRTSWTRTLAMGGSLVAVGILTLVVGNWFVPPEKAVNSRMLGHDFLAFYTAGTFLREHRGGELYDLRKVQAFQLELARREGLEGVGDGNRPEAFGPWWNPPFYGWVFVPLAGLSYRMALGVWSGMNLVALGVGMGVLGRMLGGGFRVQGSGFREEVGKKKVGWLVVLLGGVSMPVIQAVSHGQNTFTSLMILSLAVVYWRRREGFVAGLVVGLLFYKPQLAAVLAVVLVLDLGWGAVAGLALAGAMLLAVTLGTQPGMLEDYLHRLPGNLHAIQVERTYLWERHVTLKAFWRLLVQGRGPGEMGAVTAGLWWVSEVGMAGGVAWVVWRVRGSGFRVQGRGVGDASEGGVRRDRVIGATIAAMPLLMPFYFDYDLLLLAVPAVLYGRERLDRGAMEGWVDRWLPRVWCVLYLWLMVNVMVATRTRVNVSVVLLAAVAGMLVWRAAAGMKETRTDAVEVGMEMK